MKKLTSIILASLLVLGMATAYAQDANNAPPTDKPVAPEIQKGDDVKGPAPQRGWEQRQRGPMNRGEFRGGPRGPQGPAVAGNEQVGPRFGLGPQGGPRGPMMGRSPWGQGGPRGPQFAQGPRQGGPRGPMMGQGPRGGKGKCQCPCHEKQGKGKKGKGQGKGHGKWQHGPEKGPRHGPDRER